MKPILSMTIFAFLFFFALNLSAKELKICPSLGENTISGMAQSIRLYEKDPGAYDKWEYSWVSCVSKGGPAVYISDDETVDETYDLLVNRETCLDILQNMNTHIGFIYTARIRGNNVDAIQRTTETCPKIKPKKEI